MQEALTNAYKHAPGAAITVELRYEDDSLVVEIANGPAAAPGPGEVISGGQGLTGLRERARLVGGMVHAGATEGGGFRVAGVLPYGTEPAGVAEEDVADDFGQRSQARASVRRTAPPMDWAAVDRELAVPVRSRTGGVAMGCGIAVAAVVLLIIVLGAGMTLLLGSVNKAMISKEEYDSVSVGDSEKSVRDRLPDGDSVLTTGLDRKGPPRPEGTDCLALLSTEDSSTLTNDSVFRFCFRGGKLVDKQAYEVKQ
ncbi:histidine kinase OS=Streptomyces lavendulae subsp. lavendulae OX=58340 GN=liaS6 PE=4 SV=1 [Streptomyces lavendulae subsp. lavendulae]